MNNDIKKLNWNIDRLNRRFEQILEFEEAKAYLNEKSNQCKEINVCHFARPTIKNCIDIWFEFEKARLEELTK